MRVVIEDNRIIPLMGEWFLKGSIPFLLLTAFPNVIIL